MVGLEAALEIRVLHRHGKSIREIAREMGVSLEGRESIWEPRIKQSRWAQAA